ncbi:MAG: alpha/beta fold hydrolase [Nostocoides sp.]
MSLAVDSGPLHSIAVGSAGPRIAFLHGLFGQGRNWAQIAKALAGPDGDQARCLLIDLPDHGRSPWTPAGDHFSFITYADAVAQTLTAAAGDGGSSTRSDQGWTVVGHSLGGKAAMVLALLMPDLIDRLVVADITPKSYGDLHRFNGYIEKMRRLPLAAMGPTRGVVEEAFDEADPQVKAFLLQNLRREDGEWRWQVNLDLIAADADAGAGSAIADFPFRPGDVKPYPGQVLWLVGGDSGYVTQGDEDTMRAFFPRLRQVRIKGAGHWVHTDAPDVVVAALRQFLHPPTSPLR